MTENKKPSTADILAQLRQKKAEAAAAAEGAPAAPAPAAEAPAAPAAEAPAAPAADKPKSTADILAAARAGAKPAAPKSTADILAAARGAGGGAEKPAAPKSTADILAAARAAKAAAGGAPAAEKPAAAAVEAKPAAAVVVGDKPALKDMVAAVKAVQEGKPAVAAKLPNAPVTPKLPPKPVAKKADEKISRRGAFPVIVGVLLTPFVLGWTAVSAIAGLWGLGIARFMMPNMVLELPSKFQVGPPSDYPPGGVSEKYKASRGVWIVRSTAYDGQDILYALASVCTHLGCTPNWLEGEQKFKCPCHGSGFYVSGINFEGPAPRPLERVGLRRADNGMLEVDKSVKFQEELGQWGDSKSFVEVG